MIALGTSASNFAPNRRIVFPHAFSKTTETRRPRKTLPIHEIYRERYAARNLKLDLTNAKLDVVIAEVVKRHPEMDSYAKQWAMTKKLTSIQLLSILGVAMKDEDQHLNFEYFSMHARCATLLSAIREHFISSVEVVEARRMVTSPDMSLDEDSLSRCLAEQAMPNHLLAPMTTSLISLADAAASLAAESYFPQVKAQSMMLRTMGVSVKNASPLMREVINGEGDIEVKKAGALCTPQKPSENIKKDMPGDGSVSHAE